MLRILFLFLVIFLFLFVFFKVNVGNNKSLLSRKKHDPTFVSFSNITQHDIFLLHLDILVSWRWNLPLLWCIQWRKRNVFQRGQIQFSRFVLCSFPYLSYLSPSIFHFHLFPFKVSFPSSQFSLPWGREGKITVKVTTQSQGHSQGLPKIIPKSLSRSHLKNHSEGRSRSV